MNWLPKDVITLIFYDLPYPQLLNFCKSYSICGDKFWNNLLFRDFNTKGENPKELYMKYYIEREYKKYDILKLWEGRNNDKIDFYQGKLKQSNDDLQIIKMEKRLDKHLSEKLDLDQRLIKLIEQLNILFKSVLPKAQYVLKNMTSYDFDIPTEKIIFNDVELGPGNLILIKKPHRSTNFFFWDPDIPELTLEYINHNITEQISGTIFPSFPKNLIDFIAKYLHITEYPQIVTTVEILFPSIDKNF